jgi:hypothetical protein
MTLYSTEFYFASEDGSGAACMGPWAALIPSSALCGLQMHGRAYGTHRRPPVKPNNLRECSLQHCQICHTADRNS